MKRTLTTLGALVVAQALLVGIWLAVEAGREATPAATASARTSRLDRPAPDLALRGPSGVAHDLRDRLDRPLVLHFWATWCPPCREELPSLLAFAAETGTPVLAVSLDAEWPAVERLLGRAPPPEVLLAASDAVAGAFDVHALPVTFVVDAAGTLRLRLDGPRDWASTAVRAEIRDAAGAGAP
ncbi:MAG: TlpA family protein disulfide reductase [Deltaproteobacteria bacterium]|nr:MAG: TlpA family protein disulfide reductase [Deltaproteobacteria bacterium]